jgi:integrase
LLLLDTGLRASELCGLKLSDTDLDTGTIKVVGKGKKERIIPFGATTKKALLRYLATWRPEPKYPDVEELILATDGTSLSYNGLEYVIKMSISVMVPSWRSSVAQEEWLNGLYQGLGDLDVKMGKSSRRGPYGPLLPHHRTYSSYPAVSSTV